MRHSLRNYLMLIPVMALRVPAAVLICSLLKIGELGEWLFENALPLFPALDIYLEKQQARHEAQRKEAMSSYLKPTVWADSE